jgi:D-alanyl-D-alanine carboxypeptidase
MNRKASNLDMFFTSYSNPHGLSNAINLSTAKDMVILSQYASKNGLFRQIMNTQEYRYLVYKSDHTLHNKEAKCWQNTNKLLNKGFEGVKTGQTYTAGNCLSSLRNGIFIVVLNSKDL